jgi:hypothetical protein
MQHFQVVMGCQKLHLSKQLGCKQRADVAVLAGDSALFGACGWLRCGI